MPGGALNVLKDLIIEERLKHPHNEIHIFTLVSDRKTLEISSSRNPHHATLKIVTALPGRLNQLFTTRLDYRNLIVFAPRLMKILSRKINAFRPNEIHISSFAIAKNIDQCKSNTRHASPVTRTLYLHSPMQYIRSHYEEYTHKLKGWKGKLFKRIAPRLRKRDKQFTQFDEVYANSNYTAKLAKEIYGLDAKVKYPKVEKGFFDAGISVEPMPYYVYVGRLVNFVKECDRIIKLFNEIKQPLIMIGAGPDELYLKSIAGPTIIFLGRGPEGMIDIIKNAAGFINLTKESFGISTAEALLLGVPVFGYDQGGSAELVDEDSGILVGQKDHHTLINQFEEFTSRQRDRQKIVESIKKKLKII